MSVLRPSRTNQYRYDLGNSVTQILFLMQHYLWIQGKPFLSVEFQDLWKLVRKITKHIRRKCFNFQNYLVELAMIMDRLYGGVCYAGIDTDPELRYPKGAGRVAFSNQQSYIAAISARFVQLQHGEIDKRVR